MNGYQDIIHAQRLEPRRPRMPRADRAKIFAPFSALRGLDESLAARELLYVPRPLIAPDRAELLDRRLRSLRRGEPVTVTWFEVQKMENGRELGRYRVTTGPYTACRPASGILQLGEDRIETRNIVDVGRR